MEQEALKMLEEKLEKLLKKYQLLQKENTRLKDSLKAAEFTLARTQKDYEALQLKMDAGTAGQTRVMNDHQQQLLQNRIDQYLKEINKCLTLLEA